MPSISDAVDALQGSARSISGWARAVLSRLAGVRGGRETPDLLIPPELFRRSTKDASARISLEITAEDLAGPPEDETRPATEALSRWTALPLWLRGTFGVLALFAVVAGVYVTLQMHQNASPSRAESFDAGIAASSETDGRRLSLPAPPEAPPEEAIAQQRQEAIDSLLRLGELTAIDDPSEGQRAFKMVSFLAPDHPEALVGLAEVRMETGDFAGAREALENCVHYHPDMAQAWFALGLIEEVEGYLNEAEVAYSEAVRHDPDHADAHLCLGVLMGKRDDALGAAYHLRQAVTANPHHDAARYNLVVAYSGLQDRIPSTLAGQVAEALEKTEDPTMRATLQELIGETAPEVEEAETGESGAAEGPAGPTADEAAVAQGGQT